MCCGKLSVFHEKPYNNLLESHNTALPTTTLQTDKPLSILKSTANYIVTDIYHYYDNYRSYLLEIITHPAILAALIAGLILFQVHRYNAFKAASTKFRNTILQELEGLYPTPAKWPSEDIHIINILKDKFPRLEIAVTEFRGHLGFFIIKRFDKAWREYHENYSKYYPHADKGYLNDKLVYDVDTTQTYKESFKHNVDALLKFAKQP